MTDKAGLFGDSQADVLVAPTRGSNENVRIEIIKPKRQRVISEHLEYSVYLPIASSLSRYP
jgi:hypothetical protein